MGDLDKLTPDGWLRNARNRGLMTSGLLDYFVELVKWYSQDRTLIRARVVEFGVRTGTSSVAWLCAGAELHSYEIDVRARDRLIHDEMRRVEDWNERWTLTEANTLEVTIPECDILFVDDMHTYEHVWNEMDLHAPSVGSCILFHDTTTFGVYGQGGKMDDWSGASKPDPARPGIRMAIDQLLICGNWRLARSDWGHSGLITLVRKGVPFPDHLGGVHL